MCVLQRRWLIVSRQFMQQVCLGRWLHHLQQICKLHQVRKRLKRLRYLAEFVTTLYKRDAVHRFVESLEPAQDALGRHNDIAVAAAFFRREAERDPRALFAAGFLQAHLKWTAHEAGSALRKALKAPRFWQR